MKRLEREILVGKSNTVSRTSNDAARHQLGY